MAGPILLFSEDVKLVEGSERKPNADGQILFLLLWNYRCPSGFTVAAHNSWLSTTPAPGRVSLHGFTSLFFPLTECISLCGAKPTQLYHSKCQSTNPAEVREFIPCLSSLICGSYSCPVVVLFQRVQIGQLVRIIES